MMLVLASNSPRRKDLLALGGWTFSVAPAQVDEGVLAGELPAEYVCRLAESKARATLRLLESSIMPETLIIAADTAVVDDAGSDGGNTAIGYEILGKPTDAAEAESILRRLRGRTHQVYTCLAALRAADGALISEVCVTDVPMRNYGQEEMMAYITSGDPLDKAGAYAIQHPVFKPVENLAGCYANVMGLPVCHLTRMLAKFGVYPEGDIWQACQDTLDYDCPIFRQVLRGITPARPSLIIDHGATEMSES